MGELGKGNGKVKVGVGELGKGNGKVKVGDNVLPVNLLPYLAEAYLIARPYTIQRYCYKWFSLFFFPPSFFWCETGDDHHPTRDLAWVMMIPQKI